MITKKSYIHIIIIVVLLLFITKFYNFSMWTYVPYFAKIRYSILFLLPVWAYYVHIREKKRELVCEKYIRYFIFVSIFTTIIRIVFSGGGLISNDLELNIFMLSIYSTYYLLHYYMLREKDIMVALSVFGLIAFCIQVYQNIYSENALFGIYKEDTIEDTGHIALERNGLYRFVLLMPAFFVFLASYYWDKTISKNKYIFVFFAICFISQVYLMVTRQYIFAVCVMIVFSVFCHSEHRNSIWSKFLLFIGIIILILNYETLFSELFDTQSDSYLVSSNARIEAVPFLLSKAFSNPVLLFTGHGYQQQLWTWGSKGFWWSDIGVIGQIIPFGIIWVVVSFKLSYIIIVKWKESIPLYLRAYTLGMLTIFFTTSPYGNAHIVTFVWVCILYICDLYLCPEKKYLTENN